MEYPIRVKDSKTKRIVVRIKAPLHEFLESFAKNTGRTISDVVRTSIEDYHLRLLLGSLKPNTKELRRQFIEAYGDKTKRMRTLKKKKINLSNL